MGNWQVAVGHQFRYLIQKEAEPFTKELEKIYGNLWTGWGIFDGLLGELMGAQRGGQVKSPWLRTDACFINGEVQNTSNVFGISNIRDAKILKI